MIEKLKPEIKELFGMERPIYNSQALLDTVNQLVDAVNELQKNATISKMEKVEPAENVQTDTESRSENVQDKFAEQRKWIGKLCRFWIFKDGAIDIGILKAVDNLQTTLPYINDLDCSYAFCEPVKPDDPIIYKGE